MENDRRYQIIESLGFPKKAENYITGGMKIITKKKISINLDKANSTNYILAANVKPNLKLINVYV